MQNIKAVLSYDGTLYQGWQVQPGRPTVCGVFREKLFSVLGERVAVYASSRTDSGVHALAQTVNFRTNSRITPEQVKKALNSMLPSDIAVTEACEAEESFHACRDAGKRRYRYTIRNSRARCPFDRMYSHYFPMPLDVVKMKKAAALLEGTHDFSAFKSAKGEKPNRVRTLYLLEVSREGDYVCMDAAADGFLTYMVRNIAGTLVDVGRGRTAPSSMKAVLESKDRKNAGPTLPAKGLCLVSVSYPKD